MDDSVSYILALKGKAGELDALSWLRDDAQRLIRPLVDVPRPSDHAEPPDTLDNACKRFITRFLKSWRIDAPPLVDLFDVDPQLRLADGSHPLDSVLSRLHKAGLRARPVAGLDRDETYNKTVANWTVAGGGVAVRILRDEIAVPGLTVPDLAGLLDRLNVPPGAVDLVFDLRCIVDEPEEMVLKEVLAFLAHLTDIDAFRSVAVIGCGLPMNYGLYVSAGSDIEFLRKELAIWNYLRGESMFAAHKLIFGDYGVVHPDEIDLNPRLIANRMGPKVRYALEDRWYVLRGQAFSAHPRKYKQYYELARAIVGHSGYMGESYSAGDARIMRKANELEGPGQPRQWISIDMNHHVVHTLNILQEAIYNE